MADKPVKVALIGFGTVGTGVARMLLENSEHIYHKTGLRLQLAHVVDTDLQTPRPVNLPPGVLHGDLEAVLADKQTTIAVELIGGTSAAAEIAQKLLAAGKDLVTANKALLAEKGAEIFAAARQADTHIPVILMTGFGYDPNHSIVRANREGLAAVLYKPFKVDQLIGEMRSALTAST